MTGSYIFTCPHCRAVVDYACLCPTQPPFSDWIGHDNVAAAKTWVDAQKPNHVRALWNLHNAVMAGDCPTDCPDCGADEWSPSAEAFETTGRMVCEDCAEAAMERAA